MSRSAAYIAGNAVRVFLAILPDTTAIAAVGLVSYGAWLVYHPAGFISAGTLLLAGVVLHGRGQA